jgi:hypothetical protein
MTMLSIALLNITMLSIAILSITILSMTILSMTMLSIKLLSIMIYRFVTLTHHNILQNNGIKYCNKKAGTQIKFNVILSVTI